MPMPPPPPPRPPTPNPGQQADQRAMRQSQQGMTRTTGAGNYPANQRRYMPTTASDEPASSQARYAFPMGCFAVSVVLIAAILVYVVSRIFS